MVMEPRTRHIYLSHVLSESTPNYGGGKGLIISPEKDICKGNSCNTSLWNLPNHLGTHIDAPKHFFDHGDTVDGYPPSFWTCERIGILHIPLSKPRWLTPDILSNEIPRNLECILFLSEFHRYRNEKIYYEDNPGISPDLAEKLRSYFPDLRFIGMDFISVSRFKDREPGRISHRVLLNPDPPGQPILPIEDMDLSEISSDMVIRKIWIFPLRVKGADGAPATIVAEIEGS